LSYSPTHLYCSCELKEALGVTGGGVSGATA